MIKVQEWKDGYLAECDFALGYGPSQHDALDDMILALNDFRRRATPREGIKADELTRKAREMAKETRP